KQFIMRSLILEYYDCAVSALEQGADIENLISVPVRESIGRFKYIHENDIEDEYTKISMEIKKEIKEIIDSREEY
ncbi:MAG: V-type ATP synthase subunit A, partial [Clostridia bacterium]|nr:V-type ATP synthase subunit A [Clostridia bacterium]